MNHLQIPRILYGTAWKEDDTQRLVGEAIAAGFRGFDTANQRKHYNESAVGAAISEALQRSSANLKRDELFLQTKFTFRGGQDHRLPYDPREPVAVQVAQSFASSLAHLGVDFIDSYVLHGPQQGAGLSRDDWEAWRAMEALCDAGKCRWLGVSNFQLDQLIAIQRDAKTKPSFVQNRCFASNGWDRDVRAFCTDQAITYQGFSLLTANRRALASPEFAAIARRHRRTVPQVTFRFALQVGMLPLTGTTDRRHMQEDLDILGFALDDDEVRQIECIAERSTR